MANVSGKIKTTDQVIIDLKQEYDELYGKHERLGKFLSGDVFAGLIQIHQDLLRRQYSVMEEYLNILLSRISILKV